MLKIVTVPNSNLTTQTEIITDFGDSLKKLVKQMDSTLKAQVDPQGVGLAAPQIGKNLSLFIIKPAPEAKTEVFINPKIIKTIEDRKLKVENEDRSSKIEIKDPSSTLHHQSSRKKTTKLEGCLSIPKIWGSVKRAGKVLLEYQDLNGTTHKKWFSSFKSVIIQHEMDHLKGVLFTQRALEQNNQLYEEKDGELKKLQY